MVFPVRHRNRPDLGGRSCRWSAGYASGYREAAPGWNASAFAYVGSQDGLRYIQNRSGKDYRLQDGLCRLMARSGKGLIPSDSKLTADYFLPAGEAVGISITPAVPGELVLFDHGGKHRIDLHGGGDALQTK